MRYWGILIFMIIPFQLNHAQNKIYVGANFSPSLSYISETEGTKPGLKYTTGIDGLYFLDEHYFIKTGINFSQKSFTVDDIPNTMGTFIDTNGNGILDLDDRLIYGQFSTFDYTEIFQSVNFLLSLNYKFADEHKTSFVVSTGMELGYFYNTKFVIDISNGKQTIINWKYKKLTGGINLGLGLYQPIAEKFLLQVIPKYSYSFYNDRTQENRELHSLQLDIEFYFQLN